MHGLAVAGIAGVDLLTETLGLIFGVIQLGKAVGKLTTADEQLEAIGDRRVGFIPACQRRYLGRVLRDERRIVQAMFGRFLEDFGFDLARTPARLDLNAQLFGSRRGRLAVIQRCSVELRVALQHRITQGHACKRFGEIVGLTLGVNDLGVHHLTGDLLQNRLGTIHARLEVGVGLVEFEHGELGIVSRGQAFVAEIAIDLEDLFQTAHHQPLEVELGGDAQVEVNTECIVMRHEGARRRATRDRLHHRRLDLEEVLLDQITADGIDHAGARLEQVAGLGVHDQVDVALAIALLLIGQAMPLLRQRPQRLGQQHQALDLDAQLAGLRVEQRALRTDNVTHIPVLEGLVPLGTQHVALQEDLDLAGLVLHLRETGLAHNAFGHHAAGDCNPYALFVDVGTVVVLPMEIRGQRITPKVIREGIALFALFSKLLPALGNQAVFVLFAHGSLGIALRGYAPALRLASMKRSRSPSSTAWVLPTSTPVRRSLMRD